MLKQVYLNPALHSPAYNFHNNANCKKAMRRIMHMVVLLLLLLILLSKTIRRLSFRVFFNVVITCVLS